MSGYTGFTAEWLAERERKRVQKIGAAKAWNGSVDTNKIGNVEFVTVTGGGETGTGRLKPAQKAIAQSPRMTVTVGNDTARAVNQPAGPPTPLYPLVTLCRSMRIAEPIPEYRFHPQRKWRADYCWPTHMLMLEVNGGVWTQGRHTRGQGAIEDMAKLSEAAILGYRVLYCTPEQLHNGVALDRIYRALTDREAA